MSVFSVITLVLILCVIGFTISADLKIDALESELGCNPGESLIKDCNTCTCSEDGRKEYCTFKLCPTNNELIRPGHPEFICIPGDLFRHDCYDCRCYDGVNAFCTFAFCNTKNNVQHYCEDGEAKKNDCNLCKCISGEWACTKKFCVPEVDIIENKECESGTVLRRGCNTCRCISDVGYACEKEECPPDQPTDIIHDRNCKEEAVYNLGCNICKCIPALGYACDRKDCPEAVFVN